MSIPFEVVKLYLIDNHIGWQTKQPEDKRGVQESYFIKVNGMYFLLGSEEDSWYVDEGK